MRGARLLGDLKSDAPDLFGVPTGTGLDRMFYTVVFENGRYVKKPLGGIPYLSVINLTGIPDTGKSVLAEQFAIKQASSGYRVLFVTVESPAEFLYYPIKQKSEAMGADFSKVEKNIVVLDTTEDDELRENLSALLATMRDVISSKKTTVTVIDSVTGLYEQREVMARGIVRRIYNFLKKERQTALLVSQKRSSQASESAEAAGGLAVAHIVDGTVVMDKKLIETVWDVKNYGLPIGTVLRTIRIDGCRMAPHNTDSWVFEITDSGLIEIKSTLADFIKKTGGKEKN